MNWVTRTETATPAGRDRVVDALRALAMTGVVLGHWLVTGLVQGPDGELRNASPLRTLPGLAWVTWLLETLGLFFFVAGYAAARSLRGPVPAWWRGRLARLAPPVLVFLAVWVPAWLLLWLGGAPGRTLWTVGKLAVSPLWFLAVLALLLLLTPVVVPAVRRFGALAALVPFGVVVALDVLPHPEALGWLAVPAGWLVPYLLGAAVALGRPSGSHAGRRPLAPAPGAGRLPLVPGPRAGVPLLLGGLALAVALVRWGGYPVSLVGVPGQGRSNLDPPSLLVVAVAVAQIGAALCLWRPLARLLRRPAWWAGVVVVNLALFTIFLWHQTALLVVAGVTTATVGPLPGLVDAPAGTAWVAARVGWIPVFALVLAGLCTLFRPAERLARRRRAGYPVASPRPVPASSSHDL